MGGQRLRAICIRNPKARRALTDLNVLRTGLERSGYTLDCETTRGTGHATEIAASAVAKGFDLVVAAGGDGTVNEVACGLALSRIPLLVFPCGTGNVLARELTLSSDMSRFAQEISKLTPVRIALGKGNDRYFVMMAGIGVDAEIIYRLTAAFKRHLGEAAFWLEALRHWANYRFTPFSVNGPQNSWRATYAVLGRGSWYAGGVKITPRARLTTDLLDMCLFTGTSRMSYLRYLAGVTAGTHPYFHDVAYETVKTVQMTSEYPIRVQMDGENVGLLPMRFDVISDALTLMVPRALVPGNGHERQSVNPRS